MAALTATRGFSILLAIAYSCVIVTEVNAENYLCELKWVLSCLGRIPESAVAVDKANTEFIGRGLLQGSWKLGRLRLNQSFELYDDTSPVNRAQGISSFEVLTNPLGCNTEWIQRLSHTYQISSIGRTMFSGKWVLGTLTSNHLLRFVQNGEIYHREDYEILISNYPKMRTEVRNLTFNVIDQVVNAGSQKRLIGQNYLEVSDQNPTSGTRIQGTVTHEQKIREEFGFSIEFPVDTISELTVHFNNWHNFGFQTIHFVEADDLGRHRYKRIRDSVVFVTTEITGDGDLQLCSTATVFNGEMPFEALISFSENQQLMKSLLEKMKIDVVEKHLGTRNHIVYGRIAGIMSGSFVIGSGSSVGVIKREGLCSSFV